MRYSRVSAIFRKELVDILRDRRTLIGMVVIPIILYPAMILVFGPAQIDQAEAIRREAYTIVVPDADQARWLIAIIEQALADPNRTDSPDKACEARTHAAAPRRPSVITLDTRKYADIDEAVRVANDLHVGLTFTGDPGAWRSGTEAVQVRLAYDGRDLRSSEATRRTEALLTRYAERRQVEVRKQMVRELDGRDWDRRLRTLLAPVEVSSVSVTAASVFLQIMPVILVLMTVTGAIYPAVDLTAGERERGTLETLMVAPVPSLDVVTGKFLVVTVIGLITGLLNVVSVGASVRVIQVDESIHVPVSALLIILAAIIPLSMLFSAALIAVCSFARSFKESQNYVMPVVICAMVPAIMGAMPGAKLSGVARVVPVENIVLLVRELVTRDAVPWGDVLIVLLSTGLYAGGAIGVASRLFGHEAVSFADAGSYRTLFRRHTFRPAGYPSAAQALLTVAVLFPIWFHVQGIIASTTESGQAASFVWTMLLMLPVIALPPLVLSAWLKIDLRNTFSLRWGSWRGWVAAILLGLGSWAVAIELHAVQELVLPLPPAIRQALGQTDRAIRDLPLFAAVLLTAVLPAFCEELLFRGFLQAGLRHRLGKASALIGVAVVFALYHALIYRFAVTALLGLALAYLCWQSRSIFPAMLAHAMHNASIVVIGRSESLPDLLGMDESAGASLPSYVWLPACGLVALAIVLLASIRTPDAQPAGDAHGASGQV